MASSKPSRANQHYPFGNIVENSLAGIFLAQDDRFVYVNPKMAELFGYTPDELLAFSSIYDLVHEGDRGRVKETLLERIHTASHRNRLSFRGVKKGGALIDVEVSASPTTCRGTSVMIAMVLDITSVRKAARIQRDQDEHSRSARELAFEKSELEYRQLVESVQAIVWRFDAQTLQNTFVNQQAESLLGYSSECWSTEPRFFLNHVYPEDREKVMDAFRKASVSLTPHEVEFRMLAVAGRIVWLRNIIHVIALDGKASELVVIMTDITARKIAELSLHESRARLEGIINSAMDAIITIDASQRIVIFNHAAETVFKCKSEDAVGESIDRFIPEKFQVIHRQHITNFGRTGTTSRAMGALRSIPGVRADGEEFPIEASISQTHVGGQTLYTVILRDISERKKAEEMLRNTELQLLQAQKMEAIGRLAGGVAHDFNNILTGIIGYSELLMTKMAPQDPLYEEIEQIRKAGDRAANLTRQLLAFSRQQVLQTEILNLNDLIEDSARLLRRLIGEDIELTTVLDPQLGYIRADPTQISQVILNLVLNARDAMPRGGALLIETASVYLDESYARQHLSSQPGPHALLAVSDTGVGMNEEILGHIFEPFFTTKEKGKGTGLGLSTVYGIIQQSGGTIWAYSEPGQGTTFKIYLPNVKIPAPVSDKEAPIEENLQGTETILLVEDDEMVRALASRALGMNGYHVLEAVDGGKAIEICQQVGTSIDLLITDLVMPGMRGDELAARLLQSFPSISVLYMSGYTENSILQNETLEAGINFLSKPFTPTEIAHRVRKILDSRSA